MVWQAGNSSSRTRFPIITPFLPILCSKGSGAQSLHPTRLTRPSTRTLAWFAARKAPILFWWTGPGTAPADLGARLQARGLLDMAEQQAALAPGIKQTEMGAPCMAADLHKINETVLSTVPTGFVVEEVATETALQDFKHVFRASYEIPAWAGQAWVDATQAIGVGKTPWKMYVGYLDGLPVATNMLFNGAGVASVYCVGTIPTARGKGIGAAITLKPLLVARGYGISSCSAVLNRDGGLRLPAHWFSADRVANQALTSRMPILLCAEYTARWRMPGCRWRLHHHRRDRDRHPRT